ncbi:MAG: hypothetical protein GOVbin1807_44 [Prokaryotic dsDNA virus sp.]|nr:MAG: hypothetical protein GOVbin1807_44 [Prokaryotic dsDNA virus sp.]|tara:strand:+ start:1097 stop:1615 length:519 start_codon:yes stop_codon:yes gene_type:complete
MTIIHNHGAAVSGTKSEKELHRITESVGFAYLKVKEDFEKRGLSEWGRRYHKPPKLWNQKTKKGKQRKFVSDGFIPITEDGRGIIIEQKHSDKHGTTEEKVFYDLKKIQKGVYGSENVLWYVFTGEAAGDIEVYKEFCLEAEALNLDVRIIWGFDNYKKQLQKLKEKIDGQG